MRAWQETKAVSVPHSPAQRTRVGREGPILGFTLKPRVRMPKVWARLAHLFTASCGTVRGAELTPPRQCQCCHSPQGAGSDSVQEADPVSSRGGGARRLLGRTVGGRWTAWKAEPPGPVGLTLGGEDPRVLA